MINVTLCSNSLLFVLLSVQFPTRMRTMLACLQYLDYIPNRSILMVFRRCPHGERAPLGNELSVKYHVLISCPGNCKNACSTTAKPCNLLSISNSVILNAVGSALLVLLLKCPKHMRDLENFALRWKACTEVKKKSARSHSETYEFFTLPLPSHSREIVHHVPLRTKAMAWL